MEEFFFFVVFIFSPAQFLIEEMVRQETSFCLFSIILSSFLLFVSIFIIGGHRVGSDSDKPKISFGSVLILN